MQHFSLSDRSQPLRTMIVCLSLLCTVILVTNYYHRQNPGVGRRAKLLLVPIDSSADKPVHSDHLQDNEQDQQVIKSHPINMQSNSISLPTSVNFSFTSDRPSHWAPDWYENYEDMDTILSKRREEIMKRCRILKNSKQFQTRDRPRGHSRTVPMMRLSGNIRYCPTFKAGYTFWKNFKRSIPDHPYDPKETDVTFTVTRNPWHRLVSVWRDRFTLPKPGQPQHFMRQFCKGKSWKNLPPFREFIDKCILANWNSNHQMNAHWFPTLDKCLVCSKPDQLQFFLAQENMNPEAIHILKEHAGITNASTFLNSLHKKVLRPTEGIEKGISAKYQDEYKTLTAEQINKIWNIYKYEIYLFDYPHSPFVDFPKAK